MASNPKVRPVINQIEVHPFNTQTAIRQTCAKHGIAIEAYAPLARGMRMRHPVVVRLAAKYGCTPAQVCQVRFLTLQLSERFVDKGSGIRCSTAW